MEEDPNYGNGQQKPRESYNLPPINPPPMGHNLPPMNAEMHYGGYPPSVHQPYRQLNVKDALSYLDQVKQQFGDQPEVYNQFLDIMKEFKSQSIDTPGVIQRVSTLFHGHKNLIQGFNTFLPPGYKIEVQDDAMPPVVTHPNESGGMQSYQIPMPSQGNVPSPSMPPPQMHNVHTGGTVRPMHPSAQYPPMQPGQYIPQPVMQPPQQQQHHPMQQPPSQQQPSQQPSQQPTPPRKQPVEFNHAINYVNKIKTRFSSQPEIYKNFLEILHNYQKEQKTIKEVYEQVAELFHQHPDLLKEFSQFLPDAVPQGAPGIPSQPMGPRGGVPPVSVQASEENFMHTPSKKTLKGARASQKRPTGQGGPVPKKQKVRPGAAAEVPIEMSMEMGVVPSTIDRQNTFEELQYFDKIKASLNNPVAYHEFLKCLNLYSQNVLTLENVVNLVSQILGRWEEHVEWFKRFIGYKEPHYEIEQPSAVERRTSSTDKAPPVDFLKCKSYGRSYRALPKSYQNPKCSGRTELSAEVLNDVWISCPIWSEDTPFLSALKNQYEEAMFRAEDERYELDHMLELNATTIKVLENVNKRLQNMTPEEASKVKLPKNLGGTSEVLYQLGIRRIYEDRTPEIMDALQKHPAVTVPIVLARLRQKEEEWRRAQRDWNKIWREIYAKNCRRTLDYQAIHFKSNDRKTIAAKSLLQEVETQLKEQQESGETSPQFEYKISQESVLHDIRNIVTFYLENGGAAAAAEKAKVYQWFINFFSTFFGVPSLAKEANTNGAAKPSSSGDSEIVDIENNGHAKETGASSDAKSNAKEEPTPMEVDEKSLWDRSVLNIKPAVMQTDDKKNGAASTTHKTSVIYMNNTFYVMIRLFQFLYSRLEKFNNLTENPVPYLDVAMRPPKVAVELGIDYGRSSLQDVEPDQYYTTLLGLIEKFIDGKLDPNKFEELCRDMFGIEAYPLFTIDKLIHGFVKQLQVVASDDNCEKLLKYYNNNRDSPLDSYKKLAQAVVNDENLFEIAFDHVTKSLTIRLHVRTEGIPGGSMEEKWAHYVDQFLKLAPTLPPNLMPVAGKAGSVFLSRCVRRCKARTLAELKAQKLKVINNLQCKISVNTYKLFFVQETEDVFWRQTMEHKAPARAVRHKKFRNWLNGPNGWKKNPPALNSDLSWTDEAQKACDEWFLKGVDGGEEKMKVERNEEFEYCRYTL